MSTPMPRLLGLVCGIALAASLDGALATPLAMVDLKTTGGCGFQYFAEAVSPYAKQFTWSWDGACIGGALEGNGTLTERMLVGDSPITIATRTSFHAGLPFGYAVSTTLHDSSAGAPVGPDFPPSWEFFADGQQLSGSEFTGLRFDAAAPGRLPMAVPEQVPVQPRRFARMVGLRKVVMLTPSSCGSEKTAVKGCEPDSREVFLVSAIDRGSDARTNFANRTKTYCPDPFDLSSCAPLLDRSTAPLRTEILDFIESHRAAIEATTARMNAVLESSRGPATAQTAPPAAARAVETLPVGALYALADEAADRNDLVQARAALRALVRRFPDHPLAAAAARRLAAMQPQ